MGVLSRPAASVLVAAVLVSWSGAAARAQEGEPAQLTITVVGPMAGVDVWLDERILSADEIGVAVDVEPGPHFVSANRGGIELESRRVSVDDGEIVAVTLEIPSVTAAEAGAATGSSTEVDTDDGDDTAITETWWFWTAAAGVVVLTVGAILLVALSDGDPQGGSLGTVDRR